MKIRLFGTFTRKSFKNMGRSDTMKFSNTTQGKYRTSRSAVELYYKQFTAEAWSTWVPDLHCCWHQSIVDMSPEAGGCVCSQPDYQHARTHCKHDPLLRLLVRLLYLENNYYFHPGTRSSVQSSACTVGCEECVHRTCSVDNNTISFHYNCIRNVSLADLVINILWTVSQDTEFAASVSSLSISSLWKWVFINCTRVRNFQKLVFLVYFNIASPQFSPLIIFCYCCRTEVLQSKLLYPAHWDKSEGK